MKLRNYIALSLFAGMTAACDYTDLSPLDSFTDQTYWTSTNDLKLYANGLYGVLSSPSATLDNVSDNFVTSNYNSYLFDEMTVPTEASAGNGWYWNDIRACNYFMKRYSRVAGNQNEINKYVAEVKFFRGLHYFNKIKMFGDVPYYDEDLQTDDNNQLYKARDPRDFVLGKVIDDFLFAIKWLPEKSLSESGRLNKEAARAQLARIYLHFGTYKKYHNQAGTGNLSADAILKAAVLQTDTLINSGTFDIVKGTDAGCDQLPFPNYPLSYSNQFTQEDLSSNKECILARFYVTAVLTHELGRQVQNGGMGLSKDFVESFLMKNGTPIYNSGSGYVGDNDLEEELTNRDPRLYQIVDNSHKPYYVRNGVRVSNEAANRVGARKAITGYDCVKFHHANTAQQEARNSTFDWFVYRYAEVLLINAEAHAELGTCTQDVLNKTINKLRDRVDMPHLTTSPVTDAKPIDYGYTLSNLIYEIRRERRIELVAEGFRLDDLKRWNAMKLMENPKTMFGIKITPKSISGFPEGTFDSKTGRSTIEYNGATYLYQYKAAKQLDDAGRKWKANDRRFLYPLPKQELVLNKALNPQNPGWE